MIPSVDAVRVAHAFLVRRFRLKGVLNEVGVNTALALVCFPNSLGGAWRTLPALIAINHATSLGRRLRATSTDLLALYEPIRTNALPFDEVRAWFERRLEPAGRAP